MDIAIIAIGVYFISAGLATKTSSFMASLLFKIIPFLSGLFLLYTGLKDYL